MYRPPRPPLSPALMLRAYAAGIFPMSEGAGDPTLFWVDPQRRGVFPLDRFHVSRSLKRRIRKGGFDVRVNSDFLGTVAGCADRELTWINAEIFQCYMSLHATGHAHSVEVWEDNTLVGGVFGVVLGGAFFGESMFSRRKDASKIALAWLIARLNHGGFRLFDTQFRDRAFAVAGGCGSARAPSTATRCSTRLAAPRIFSRCPRGYRLRTCWRI